MRPELRLLRVHAPRVAHGGGGGPGGPSALPPRSAPAEPGGLRAPRSPSSTDGGTPRRRPSWLAALALPPGRARSGSGGGSPACRPAQSPAPPPARGALGLVVPPPSGGGKGPAADPPRGRAGVRATPLASILPEPAPGLSLSRLPGGRLGVWGCRGSGARGSLSGHGGADRHRLSSSGVRGLPMAGRPVCCPEGLSWSQRPTCHLHSSQLSRNGNHERINLPRFRVTPPKLINN